ncbi:MAG: ABC transporter permease, partial [Alphaproteobacteria bacterium]|nr:ABC transporter permease [Alphaproteobacteria bacterium]
MRFVAAIGAVFLTFLTNTGRIVMFAGLALATAFTPPLYLRAILREMINIGYFSLPVVGLTAIFTGMVLALQSYTGFSRFAAEGAVAT